MCKRMSIIGVAIVTLMLLSVPARADVSTFQDGVAGYTGAEDNPIGNYFYNWGSSPEMSVAEDIPNAREVRILIRFDITSIPTDATVTSAKLSLQQFYADGAGTISAYEVYKPWTEMGSDWWGYDVGMPWEISGCDGTTDRSFTPLDSVSCTLGSIRYEWDVTSAAQGWVSNPTANNGVLMDTPTPPFGVSVSAFRSSESTVVSEHPALEVEWIPEPATMSLLGLGALVLLRRRK